MKPSKTGNKVQSDSKSTNRYVPLPPGAIWKGRGRGVKSMCSLGVSADGVRSFSKCSFCASQGMQTRSTKPLALEEEHMQPDFLMPTDKVMKYIQVFNTNAIGKGQVQWRGLGLKSMCSLGDSEDEVESFNKTSRSASQDIQKSIKRLALEKEHMQVDFLVPPSTEKVVKYNQMLETSSTKNGRGRRLGLKSVSSLGELDNEVESFSKSSVSASQGMQTTGAKSSALEKELMQTNFQFPASTEKVAKYNKTFVTGSIGKGRGQV